MAYIEFLDILGTRAKAALGDNDYTKLVNLFNEKLFYLSENFNGKVYAYSDNAYVQFKDLDDMINFFRQLRDALMFDHYYFCAAGDKGTLSSKSEPFENKDGFYSMKFTSEAAVEVYRLQSQCTGIGIFLSETIVANLIRRNQRTFCSSICLKNELVNNEFALMPVYDISYTGVSIEKIQFIFDDYLITASTNPRAGRYYISAIISMLKCINPSRFTNDDELHTIIKLASFQTIPECFQRIDHNKTYIIYFFFALIENVLSSIDSDNFLESKAMEVCKNIIIEFGIEHSELISSLSKMPSAIIKEKNKQDFLSILFNINQEK